MTAIHSEQINELATALAKAQAEMGNAAFNRVNPAFKSKYADLASIRDATMPALTKHGLSLFQVTELNATEMLLITRLAHTSGQWLQSVYPITVNERPHIMGSALTYARRYSWAAICGVAAEEDDDANAAQEGAKNGQPVKRTRQEISDDANRKRQQVRDVDADIQQIDNLVALDRYEREVLTPEFMAGLGMKQWAVEQRVGERRRELENLQADALDDDHADFRKCRNWLGAATTATDLVRRAKDEKYVAWLPQLTDAQRDALRAYYKQRLGEFGRAEVAQ
jgi:hypothetical protein